MHELTISEMLGEISYDDRLLIPFSSQAAAFATVQMDIASFSLATFLRDYVRAYNTKVLILA